ncbi:MAG: hypothetical protein IPJ65_31410 [Archangiaceae bacterium]|nr:hypothetical protein [Archangiaceae bacterium]
MKKRTSSAFDLVSAEARKTVDGWPETSRGLFSELLEDAPTDLQRELLNRAVAAGHSAAEVHAFADALRGLGDVEVFDRCTVDHQVAAGYSVVQLLKAEADPLFAFKLKGGELSPRDDAPRLPAGYSPPGSPNRPRPGFELTDPRLAQHRFDSGAGPALRKNPRAAHELGQSPEANEETVLKKNPALARRELGESAVAKVDGPSAPRASMGAPRPRPSLGAVAASPGSALAPEQLNEALQSLGVSFKEQQVDGPNQPRLEEVMAQAAQALQKGLPVPVALGPAPGQDRRLALFLQLQVSGKSRAYQLFDVLSQELAWINEGDLFARAELPFASKQNRRITRIALPVSRF